MFNERKAQAARRGGASTQAKLAGRAGACAAEDCPAASGEKPAHFAPASRCIAPAVRLETGANYPWFSQFAPRDLLPRRLLVVLGLAASALMLGWLPAHAQQVQWQNLITTALPAGDYRSVEPVAVAADATGVIVAGNVYGRLPGQTSGGEGNSDLFVRRYDVQGHILWTRQIAAPDGQFLSAMAADGSGIYLAARDLGARNEFVARLDPVDGRLLWTRPIAADFRKSLSSIALHPSGIYVGGQARTADFEDPRPFLQRLDRDGTSVWSIDVDIPAPALYPTVSGIAFGPGGIYVSGEFGSLVGVVLRRFDFDGRWLGDVQDPAGATLASGPVVADAEGLAVVAHRGRGSRGAIVHRHAYDGSLLWKADVTGEYYATGLAIDGGDVLLSTDAQGGIPSSMVRRYGPNGTELWSWRLQPYISHTTTRVLALAASGGQVYTAAYEPADPTWTTWRTVVTRLGQDLPAQLQAVRQRSPTPRTALAVLVHDSSTGGVAALLRDAASGALLRRVPFDAAWWPRAMVRVPDMNGNGSDELALLGANRRNGLRAAQVRDSLTGASLGLVPFDPGYTPVKMLALPDLDGNGASELAVLERSTSIYVDGDVPAQAEVRDARTGLVLRRVDFTGFAHQEGKIDFAALADSNGNGSPELAIVGNQACCSSSALVAISDALTGAPLRQQFLPRPEYGARVSLAALPDSDGNGLPELAAVAPNEWGAAPGTRALIYEGIPDAPQVLRPPKRSIAFTRGDTTDSPRPAVVVVPDVNGNAYPELAVLRSRVTPGRDEIQVKDAFTGHPIGNFGYDAQGLQFRAVAVIDDLNGNGSAEIAVLRRQTASGRHFVLIKDARTGATIRSIAY